MHTAAPASEPGSSPGAGRLPVDPIVDDLIIAVDHVGLAVADLAAAIALHTEVFGWRVVHTETNVDQGVVEAMLAAGDGTGAQLQLMAPLDDTSPIAKFLDRRGPGLQQVAYRVGDVAAVTEVLRGRGVRLVYDAPRRGTADTMINFVHPHDTGGVLIELVQHPIGTEPKKSSQEQPNSAVRIGPSDPEA